MALSDDNTGFVVWWVNAGFWYIAFNRIRVYNERNQDIQEGTIMIKQGDTVRLLSDDKPAKVTGIFQGAITGEYFELQYMDGSKGTCLPEECYAVARRSDKEIEELKKNWLHDPCWDIEDSYGYEAHYEELKAYRLEREKAWDDNYNTKLSLRSYELGIPGNLRLTVYIASLEDKLKRLEARLDALENNAK